MRSLKTVIVAAGLLVLSIGIPAALMAPAASAATTPVVYASVTGGWTHPGVRPSWIVVGMGGAPVAHIPYWSTWDKGEPAPHATSNGTLLVDNCIPDCAQGKESSHRLVVTLFGRADPQRRPVLLAYGLVHTRLPAVWLPHQHRRPALQHDLGHSAVLALISSGGSVNLQVTEPDGRVAG